MKVGDLVRWHDSASRRFKAGIIVERHERKGEYSSALFLTYLVLWNSGKLTKCSPWQLFRIRNESR